MTYCALCGLTRTHWQGCTETARRPYAWSYSAASLFAAMVEAAREEHRKRTIVRAWYSVDDSEKGVTPAPLERPGVEDEPDWKAPPMAHDTPAVYPSSESGWSA